jgi:hypothetical protein
MAAEVMSLASTSGRTSSLNPALHFCVEAGKASTRYFRQSEVVVLVDNLLRGILVLKLRLRQFPPGAAPTAGSDSRLP